MYLLRKNLTSITVIIHLFFFRIRMSQETNQNEIITRFENNFDSLKEEYNQLINYISTIVSQPNDNKIPGPDHQPIILPKQNIQLLSNMLIILDRDISSLTSSIQDVNELVSLGKSNTDEQITQNKIDEIKKNDQIIKTIGPLIYLMKSHSHSSNEQAQSNSL